MSVDCGPPPNPRNGSLESYTITTEGSVVFYSCDAALVPEGRVMSVCTGIGWSPNPACLDCNVGTLQVPDSDDNDPLFALFMVCQVTLVIH